MEDNVKVGVGGVKLRAMKVGVVGRRWETTETTKRGRNHTSQVYHAKDNRHWDNRDEKR